MKGLQRRLVDSLYGRRRRSGRTRRLPASLKVSAGPLDACAEKASRSSAPARCAALKSLSCALILASSRIKARRGRRRRPHLIPSVRLLFHRRDGPAPALVVVHRDRLAADVDAVVPWLLLLDVAGHFVYPALLNESRRSVGCSALSDDISIRALTRRPLRGLAACKPLASGWPLHLEGLCRRRCSLFRTH